MKTKSGLSRSFLKFKSVRTNHIEQCATSHIIEMVDELADPPLRTNNRRELPTFPRISTKSEADSKKLHPPPPPPKARVEPPFSPTHTQNEAKHHRTQRDLAHLSAERLVKGAPRRVGGETEGAGDGGCGGPRRGRHAAAVACCCARVSSAALRRDAMVGEARRRRRGWGGVEAKRGKRKRRKGGVKRKEKWRVETSWVCSKRGRNKYGEKGKGKKKRKRKRKNRRGGERLKAGGGSESGAGLACGGGARDPRAGSNGRRPCSLHPPYARTVDEEGGGRGAAASTKSPAFSTIMDWTVWIFFYLKEKKSSAKTRVSLKYLNELLVL